MKKEKINKTQVYMDCLEGLCCQRSRLQQKDSLLSLTYTYINDSISYLKFIIMGTLRLDHEPAELPDANEIGVIKGKLWELHAEFIAIRTGHETKISQQQWKIFRAANALLAQLPVVDQRNMRDELAAAAKMPA